MQSLEIVTVDSSQQASQPSSFSWARGPDEDLATAVREKRQRNSFEWEEKALSDIREKRMWLNPEWRAITLKQKSSVHARLELLKGAGEYVADYDTRISRRMMNMADPAKEAVKFSNNRRHQVNVIPCILHSGNQPDPATDYEQHLMEDQPWAWSESTRTARRTEHFNTAA